MPDSPALWPVDLPSCRLWPMESEDGYRLQELFDDLTDFPTAFGERGDADAVSTYIALPEGAGYDAKLLLGIWRDATLIGAIDCIMGYPSDDAWTVGLLVVAERHRHRGVATSVLQWLETTAKSRGGATVIRIGLLERNTAGRSFLERRGYRREKTAASAPEVTIMIKAP